MIRNEVWAHATTWTNPENIMLRKSDKEGETNKLDRISRISKFIRDMM